MGVALWSLLRWLRKWLSPQGWEGRSGTLGSQLRAPYSVPVGRACPPRRWSHGRSRHSCICQAVFGRSAIDASNRTTIDWRTRVRNQPAFSPLPVHPLWCCSWASPWQAPHSAVCSRSHRRTALKWGRSGAAFLLLSGISRSASRWLAGLAADIWSARNIVVAGVVVSSVGLVCLATRNSPEIVALAQSFWGRIWGGANWRIPRDD